MFQRVFYPPPNTFNKTTTTPPAPDPIPADNCCSLFSSRATSDFQHSGVLIRPSKSSLSLITPLECTDYYKSGVAVDGIAVSKEYYTAKFIFEDNNAETVGSLSVKCPTVAAYNAAVTAVLADTALATAIGGDCIHNSEKDSFSCTLKCHDANGEIYYVALGRDNVRLTSYPDDSIRNKVETWADGVTALV